MKVLLVEDEVQLAKNLQIILEHHNYNVDIVHDGQIALDYYNTYDYDLIILDIMLPSLNGIEVLTRIRSLNKDIRIIMLSAKSLVEDKVKCLNLEADDYLSKPFSSEELIARINSCLRRGSAKINVNTIGDLTLDLDNYILKTDSSEFKLSKKEFMILKILFLNKNNIVTHNTLFNKVWSCESDVNDTILWTYISYLRKKIRLLDSNVKINIIRGVGYSIGDNND